MLKTALAEEGTVGVHSLTFRFGSIVIVGERLLQSNENFLARYKLNSHTADIGELTQPTLRR